jgi:hypothetical protein
MMCVIDVGAPRLLVQAAEDRSLGEQGQTVQAQILRSTLYSVFT